MNTTISETSVKVPKNKVKNKNTNLNYANLDLDVFLEEISLNNSRSNVYNLKKDWISFTHSLGNDMFIKSFK